MRVDENNRNYFIDIIDSESIKVTSSELDEPKITIKIKSKTHKKIRSIRDYEAIIKGYHYIINGILEITNDTKKHKEKIEGGDNA